MKIQQSIQLLAFNTHPKSGWLARRLLLAFLLLPGVLHAIEFTSSGFALETVANGLNLPTAVAFHTDGRIFIAQKDGVVRVVENNRLLETPFIELSSVNTWGDRGLIGIAVDPEFDSNGFVYLAYTYENDSANREGAKTARVVRVTAEGNTAVNGSERVLLGSVAGTPSAPSCVDYDVYADCIASDSITHTVGGLRFGPDRKLYVAIGDGADFNGIDMLAFRAQDLDNLSGKLLRIETDGRAVNDNPFFTGNPDDNRSKVWAYGFRNPYRFSFHPDDGRIFGGDVGWSDREEVNYIRRGRNYGWPCREGKAPAGGGYPDLEQCLNFAEFTDPIYDYLHFEREGAVTGGAFAMNSRYPRWIQGRYIFADFSYSTFQTLLLDENSEVEQATLLATDTGGPVEIVTGSDGYIYYLSIYRGELIRIVPDDHSAEVAPVAVASFEISLDSPLTVQFDAKRSSDPSGEIVGYRWQFGDGSTGEGISLSHAYTAAGMYDVTLTVTNSAGVSATTTVSVELSELPVSDSQPVFNSLAGLSPPHYLGSPISFRVSLGNQLNGEPFSVAVEFFDDLDERAGIVWLRSIQISAGDTNDYEFSWLPVGVGNYYANLSFFHNDRTRRLQSVIQRVHDFQVVPRATPRPVVQTQQGGDQVQLVQAGSILFPGLCALWVLAVIRIVLRRPYART